MFHQQLLPAKGEKRAAQASEFLTFRVGNEHYGVAILNVQEIRRWESVTSIADSPEFVKGVVNLRGTIVPIIDMRLKLKSAEATYDDLTAVIVLNMGTRVIGIVVDAVSEVVALGAQDIRPLPNVSVFAMRGILGIGTHEDRMLILLDIERLLTKPETAALDGVVH